MHTTYASYYTRKIPFSTPQWSQQLDPRVLKILHVKRFMQQLDPRATTHATSISHHRLHHRGGAHRQRIDIHMEGDDELASVYNASSLSLWLRSISTRFQNMIRFQIQIYPLDNLVTT